MIPFSEEWLAERERMRRRVKRHLGRYQRGNWRAVPMAFRAEMEKLRRQRSGR